MTHEITLSVHHVAGESLTQEFTVEENGSAKDITGASVSWYLLPVAGADTADAVLDDGDSGVSASIVNAGNGRVDVEIDQDTTTGQAGKRLWQRLVVDGAGSGKQVWGGDFPVVQP